MDGLKLVIVARHGHYSRDTRSLDDRGKEQSKVLAQAIANLVNESAKIALLTSPEKRAVETSTIIAETLGVSPHTCAPLSCDEFYERDEVMKALPNVLSDEEVLIAITHHRLPAGIIHAFRQKHFANEFDNQVIGTGQGITLCLKTGKLLLIP